MSRARAIVPVLAAILFAVFPLLSLFAQNQTDLELSVLWWPLAISIGAAVVLFAIFALATRRAAKAGVLASLGVVAVFYFGSIAEQVSISEGWLLALWLALLAAAVVAVLRTRRDLGNLTLVLAVGAAALTVPQAVKIAAYDASHSAPSATDSRLWPAPLAPPVAARGAPPPDIYMIIPDDYVRLDVLRRYFHYDDAAFVRELRRRGFVVSPRSVSPYSDSESNIASTLNLDYLSRFPRVLGASSQDVRPLKRVIADNRASRLLKPLGYRYVHLDTDEVTFAGGNPDISPLAPPDSFMNLWLRKSVLRRVGGALGFDQAARDARYRDSVRSVFAKLATVPRSPGPKFVVFHTLLPHDPYVFRASGRPVSVANRSDVDLASAAGRRNYVQQLRDLNRRLLESIDRIVAGSRTPPVIVLQSDEGFSANPDTFGEAAMRAIRVKGLTAFRLPGGGPTDVPRPPNAVNTLRYVFNRYLGTHYPLLRSASYPEGDLPYQFQEMRVP